MGRFERDGLAFSYEEMGEPDTPPVVLLHGLGGESRQWYPIMRGLQRSYHLVAPDLRGHGLSTAPEEPADHGIEAFTGDLEALLDHLETDLAAVVGTGFGGAVALQFAVTEPARVAALCLADTTPAHTSDRYGPELMEQEAGFEQLEQRVRERGTRVLGRDRAEGIRDPRFVSALVAQARRTSVAGWLEMARARRTRPDLTAQLRERLTMPVLICGGSDDPARSAFEVLCEEVDGARAVTFTNTGHGVPVQRPDSFLRVLMIFLQDVERGRRVEGASTV